MIIGYYWGWFKTNANSFSYWFDPETFDWRESWLLATFCSKDFNKWFDAETFNWGEYSDDVDSWLHSGSRRWGGKSELIHYCLDYIDIWYDPNKFSISYDEILIRSIK